MYGCVYIYVVGFWGTDNPRTESLFLPLGLVFFLSLSLFGLKMGKLQLTWSLGVSEKNWPNEVSGETWEVGGVHVLKGRQIVFKT